MRRSQPRQPRMHFRHSTLHAIARVPRPQPSRLFDRMLAGDAGSWTIQLVHLELAWNLPYFGASALLGPLPCLAAGLVYLARAGDVGMGGAGGSGTPCVGCW